MKHILSMITVTVALTCLVACGGKKESPAEVAEITEEQNTQLAEALSVGNIAEASAMADSMSLFVDDFTPEQTVQVLMAFLTVHNDAVASKNTRRDLETLRKFVDVYDIALSANPKDTRRAFDKARKINPEINFDSLATAFRSKLTQYDAVQDGSLVAPEPVRADTVAVDSAKKADELPLELRPAE
ncbi:MAG: hypothetical protein K2O30_11325 [Duncaniella sp.]|nr:hypothetical protein [Duncaniella sp.]MDE7146719.1 hypothetical protein [Duncaniella sp.]